MGKLNVEKVFVLHVKKGYEARLESIKKQFAAFGIDFELILDGDIPDLDKTTLEKYFKGGIKENANAVTSCTMKHLLAYEQVVNNGYKDCLIFEDDIILMPNCLEVINKTLEEIKTRPDINKKRAFISYENSRMKLVPASKRIPGQYLYKADSPRYAGAYYITGDIARSIMQHTLRYKCDYVSDWYLNIYQKEFNMDIYWCHPPVAEQGSHSGKFTSGLNRKKAGLLRRIAWNSQKIYKSILINFK
ncbi:MAG: glycosyltransferase family 25 protein [Bacteroidales bacterium]|nr:glycosyltransferase family 25 protein [Bacteroidales bacterium]